MKAQSLANEKTYYATNVNAYCAISFPVITVVLLLLSVYYRFSFCTEMNNNMKKLKYSHIDDDDNDADDDDDVDDNDNEINNQINTLLTVNWRIGVDVCCCSFRCSGTGNWFSNLKETSCLPLLNAGFEPRGSPEPNLQQTECPLTNRQSYRESS